MRRLSFVRDCVPPHPDPLPQGEGKPCAALGGIETLRIRDQRRIGAAVHFAAGRESNSIGEPTLASPAATTCQYMPLRLWWRVAGSRTKRSASSPKRLANL